MYSFYVCDSTILKISSTMCPCIKIFLTSPIYCQSFEYSKRGRQQQWQDFKAQSIVSCRMSLLSLKSACVQMALQPVLHKQPDHSPCFCVCSHHGSYIAVLCAYILRQIQSTVWKHFNITVHFLVHYLSIHFVSPPLLLSFSPAAGEWEMPRGYGWAQFTQASH